MHVPPRRLRLGWKLGAVTLWTLTQGSCSLVGYRELEDAQQLVRADADAPPAPEAGAAEASIRDATVFSDAQVVADAGEPDADTMEMDASEPDASAPLDASKPADDATAELPPIAFPDDAGGSPDAGPTGTKDAGAASDAGATDAGVTACAGARAVGLCWYLGGFGASCDQACTNHGGFDSRAIAHVGTARQGGSLSDCRQILSALGLSSAPIHAYRTDNYALACHEWYTGTTYWLDDPSAWFRSSSSGPYARIACGCKR